MLWIRVWASSSKFDFHWWNMDQNSPWWWVLHICVQALHESIIISWRAPQEIGLFYVRPYGIRPLRGLTRVFSLVVPAIDPFHCVRPHQTRIPKALSFQPNYSPQPWAVSVSAVHWMAMGITFFSRPAQFLHRAWYSGWVRLLAVQRELCGGACKLSLVACRCGWSSPAPILVDSWSTFFLHRTWHPAATVLCLFLGKICPD